MYITPQEVLANIKGLPTNDTGQLTTEIIQTFINDGASEINGKLDGIYFMPLPDAPTEEDAVDDYVISRAILKTTLQYYCMMRVELYMNIQGGFDDFMWQSVTNRKVYQGLYNEKIKGLLEMREALPGVEIRELVSSQFPESKYNEYNTLPNW